MSMNSAPKDDSPGCNQLTIKNLYPILLSLSRISNLQEFWKNACQELTHHFSGCIGCCFAFYSAGKLRIESMISKEKTFEMSQQKFFIDNPLIIKAIESQTITSFSQKDLNIESKDDFLSSWMLEKNFDRLFIFPIHGFETCSVVFVALQNHKEMSENDWEEAISLIVLYIGLFYERLLNRHTLALAQDTLISNDKIATLGHLTAGMIHEMNSPLGVIKASSANISDALNKILKDVPTILTSINPKNTDAFLKLMSLALRPKELLSSREERIRKKELVTALQEHHIENPDTFAEILVDIGIYQDVTPLLRELGSGMPSVLNFVYNVSSINRNNDNVIAAIERTTRMIIAVKSYSHTESSEEMKPSNLQNGLETVLTLYQHELKQNINLIKKLQPVPAVLCNQDEIYQVWTNLIYNALQAMNFEGTLEIETCADNDFVTVNISDTGPGIPENIKDRIFDPYFTTKPRGIGSGLGLGIVRKIVQKHSGNISFISQPGKTTFTVKLPINKN